jgi:hypothetical protein
MSIIRYNIGIRFYLDVHTLKGFKKYKNKYFHIVNMRLR